MTWQYIVYVATYTPLDSHLNNRGMDPLNFIEMERNLIHSGIFFFFFFFFIFAVVTMILYFSLSGDLCEWVAKGVKETELLLKQI
jgi:hypothetical protein